MITMSEEETINNVTEEINEESNEEIVDEMKADGDENDPSLIPGPKSKSSKQDANVSSFFLFFEFLRLSVSII